MPTPDEVWKRIAELLPQLGSPDDRLVGRTLDAIDKVLAANKLSWGLVGQRLLLKPPPAGKPDGGRAPSQWKIDRDMMLQAYEKRERLDAWGAEFLESLHNQMIEQNRGLTALQKDKLYEQLDKLGL